MYITYTNTISGSWKIYTLVGHTTIGSGMRLASTAWLFTIYFPQWCYSMLSRW